MPRCSKHPRANFPQIPDHDTYYVYGFYDQDTLFYIGKGRSYRFTKHFSQYHLKENTPKNNKIKQVNKEGRKVDVKLFAIHLSEIEALDLERKLILSFGLKSEGGILTNLRYGSLDSAGLWTEDRKKRHSEKLRGKNSEVPVDLVKKAKCLSYYCGYTAKEISEHPDFRKFNLAPHTINAWCRGNKFKYVLPHLNHDRSSLREEKYQETAMLLKKGWRVKEISDTLGLGLGLVKLYNTCYQKQTKEQ